MIPKVAHWKKDTVSSLTDMVNNGGTLAVIDIHGVPADAMLGMRADLRSKMSILVAKKRLMKIAWESAGHDFTDLEELYLSAIQPALVQTDMNSFEVYSELKKTEAGRAAKPGDVAPHDIVVEEMDTGMPPGPIVGELNSVGIPAKIVKGSVKIQKKTTILNEGDVFEGDLGMMLSKIGINPIITGLRLCGTLEDGVRFPPESLDLDYEKFESDLINSGAGAFNLACNIRWFSSQTTPTLLAKASSDALAVAMEAAIVTSDTLPHFISRAHHGALGIAGSLDNDALDDELSHLLGAAAEAAVSTAETVSSTDEAPAEAEADEKEEEEEGSFDGLGSLFG